MTLVTCHRPAVLLAHAQDYCSATVAQQVRVQQLQLVHQQPEQLARLYFFACLSTLQQQKRDIPIDQQQIQAIINAEDDAASDVLQSIYSFIHSDAYR